MFNKFKTTTLAVVTAAATLLGSGQAWAFEVPSAYDEITGNIGTCEVYITHYEYSAGINDGNTYILVGGFSFENNVSPIYELGSLRTYTPALNQAYVENNCGVTGITNFSIDAANTTYALDDYVGLVVEGIDPDNGLPTRWEAAIVGVTNTQLVFTKTIADATPPTVTLSSTTTTLNGTDPFTVTATFDEAVTGFDPENDINDIIIVGGTLAGFVKVSDDIYKLFIDPTGAGDLKITIPAGSNELPVAQDLAGNHNDMGTLTIPNQIVEITQEAIAGFMLGRANNLASNQPGLTRFLLGDGCGSFNANATEGSGSIDGCVSRGNSWAEVTSSWSGDDSYILSTIGTHTFLNPNLIVGGMFQIDSAKDDANKASGIGYMVGPYFVAQVPDQPLFFEGRLLYGHTDNDISPLGTYTDSFETERWLAQLRATGEYQVQNTTLMPLLDFTYTDDTQKAYTDSLGNTIPGQTVSLMQASVGMDFSTPITVSSGSLDLTGGLSGIYSATDGGAAAPEFENWRGRTHLGLNYAMNEGVNLSATTFYDGIGTDYESYGASFGLDMKF